MLSNQLRDLQRRSRDALGHPFLRHPSAGPLRSIGQTLASNIRRIHEIVRRSAHKQAGDPADRSLAGLISASHRLVSSVASQIALCESTARQTSAAVEVARRLLAQERVLYGELLPLYDRVFDEVRDAKALSPLTPMAGMPPASFVDSQHQGGEAAVFVEGAIAARLLVWTMRDDERLVSSLPYIALAAQFQDIGRLLATSGATAGLRFRQKRRDWLNRQHPSIGAAILGAVRGAPVELALMAGQHHERLDGGGFPRALTARDILPASAMLAAAGRFVELSLSAGFESESACTGENWAVDIAELLLAEAERGLWSTEFARKLWRRVVETENDDANIPSAAALPLETAVEEKSSGEALPEGKSARERNLQLHFEEQRLQGTHAASRGRFVAVTLDEIRRSRPKDA